MLLQDVIFAAIMALVVFWFVKSVSRIVTIVVTRSTELGYRPGDIEMVLQRCYGLFPIDMLIFKGATFHRGMSVKAITNRNKTIEGQFVGTNKDNMVCFLTPSSVVAFELGSIEEIRLMES